MIKFILVEKPLMMNYGVYHHTKVTLEQVLGVLKEGSFVSAIENPFVKQNVEDLLGLKTPMPNYSLEGHDRNTQVVCFQFADFIDEFSTRQELIDNCQVSLITLM